VQPSIRFRTCRDRRAIARWHRSAERLVRIFHKPAIGVLMLAVAAALAVGPAGAVAQRSLMFDMVSIKQSRPGYWQAAAVYPRFRGKSPLEVLANITLKDAAEKEMQTFVRLAIETLQTLPKPTSVYEYRSTAAVSLARATLVSVYLSTDEYTGGAHGNTFYYAYTFGMAEGATRQLTLQDLFRPGADGRRAASDQVIAALKRNPAALWVQDGTLKEITAGMASRFVVTPTALTFLIQPYEAGPYSSGSFFVKIPFSEFGGTLDPNGPLKDLLH